MKSKVCSEEQTCHSWYRGEGEFVKDFWVQKKPRGVLLNPCALCLTQSPLQRYYGTARYVVLRYMEAMPVTEPVLLILLSLAEQPRHGYSILKDVEEISRGRVKLSTGTLYGALGRLLEAGWIEPVEEVETPRGRRGYRLTTRGQRSLQLEVDRMKQLTKLASLRVARKET
jgi:DNA-binding PadR family transcriptional regulator